MPKINLWTGHRSNDFKFIDNAVRESMNIGGTGVILHKYIGPTENSNETNILDVVFMENRSRKYDDTLYDLKGHYNPENSDFDLTQFGLFLSNDYIFIEFHLTEMVERLGRKIMSGDVIELPHLREFYTLNENDPAFNKYFVVEDAFRSSSGYGPTWWPHIWRVKAKSLTDSEEYKDIVDKSGLREIISTYNKELCITEQVVCEAEQEVQYDPTYYEGYHYFIHSDENGVPCVYWGTGDGIPPNGKELRGTGTKFPEDMQDGEYFLRTDFNPPALYIKRGCKFTKVEHDLRKEWTGQNKLLDSFIDNNATDTLGDGTVYNQKQALSKVVKPRDGE